MVTSTEPKPIVVGVDGSASSIAALRKAAELARMMDVPLEAVTAWQFPITYDASFPTGDWSPEGDAEDILADALERAFPEGRPERLRTSIRPGPVAASLIDMSDHASMLVLGSRGRGGFVGLLLGSVSATCAQHARCPVLIMHEPKKAPVA
ncbi:universal stress protein [Microbacterium sp.]|jgi:nucleotide-binding universal stress UspA family protein|uniref:universal stress protein n=1 Tax=Microbacterium sp. TaxID=51671 RepID=UPI0037CA397F